jgi:SSS family transporter
MNSTFTAVDWLVFLGYFAILAVSSYIFSKFEVKNARDYFVASNSMPLLGVAISIVATSQSAATFLGAPEFAYAHNFTFIGFYFSALLAVFFIAKFLIPKFYAMRAVTVYELLEKRYGERAKKEAGIMFLLGRILASGARLYIGALAISMILFLDITFWHMLFSVVLLVFGALLYAYFGGIKSIIYSDIIQALTYVGAGLLVLWYLYSSLGETNIIQALQDHNKLLFFDTSLDGKFSLPALLGGWLLLNIAAFGLDQDMAQRVLSCKNREDATKSLILSIIITIPIVLLFLAIGALLFLHYQQQPPTQAFEGESITVFMYYILNEMPEGLRGLVTVGAIAAALSSTNSVLGAMASVAIEDIYKPYRLKKDPKLSDAYFLSASRKAVLFFALILTVMAMVSYFWQRYSDLSLIGFALGVMSFAYAGLLGVYFAAIFTKRGSAKTVLPALVGGFLTVLALQPYVFGIHIGFAWELLLGTFVSFFIMLINF